MARRFDRRRALEASALFGMSLVAGPPRPVAARQTATPAPTRWLQGVPIPEARSETAAAVIDERIYVAGGFHAGSRVDAFDPPSQAWIEIAPLPIEVHHPGVAALGGSLHVAGGYLNNGHSAVRALWRFDAAGGAWQPLRPLPEPKGAFGLVAADGALFAVGGAFGKLGGQVSGDLLRYDPHLDQWEALEPMPTPREHLAAAFVNGKIHAIGGRANGDESDEFGAAHEVYDLAAGSWSTAEPLPVPRSGLSGVAVDGTIVVLGGEREDVTFADANRYNPSTGTWEALPPMPTARHGLASAYLGGLLYAITGSVKAGGVDNTPVVEVLPIDAAGSPTA